MKRILRTTVWTLVKRVLLAGYGLLIRVRVAGRVALPLRRGFVVAANHLTGADSLVIQIALRTRLFFVTSARWFAGRFSGFFMRNVCDSVAAGSGRAFESIAGLRRCVRTLLAGGSVGIYPEGRLNRQGRIDAVEDGAAWLAARTGVPILPVYVRNLKLGPEPYSRPWLNEAWEGFFSVARNLLNTDIEVVLGEPILPDQDAARDPGRLRQEVARLSAELSGRLTELARAVPHCR